VIVKYADGVSTAQRVALFDRTGVRKTLGSVGGVGAKVVRVSGDPATAAARLNRSSLVRYAEPNRILRVQAIPNDPRFAELRGFDEIDAPEGWDAAGLGAFPASGGVKIGIVDTGIDQAHPDLTGQTVACARSQGLLPILSGTIEVGQCADDNDHGTHVAGTIAAKANNGLGVAGVAFNADLVVCKALSGPLGSGSTADVANCIDWVASQGAKVISMSLGGGASTTPTRTSQTSTPTSRWRRRAWASCQRSAVAATRPSRVRRWRLRTCRRSPACCGSCSRPRTRRRSATA
jgi:thermitase